MPPDSSALIRLGVVFGLSLMGAIVLFLLGGSLAEVSNNSDNFLGLGFKASGLIAGFIIIFTLSERSLHRFDDDAAKKLPPAAFDVHLKLKGKPKRFSKSDDYTAVCTITREGKSHEIVVEQTRWDDTYLVVDLTDIHTDDLISAVVRKDDHLWRVSGFYIKEPVREASWRQTVTTWAESPTQTSRRMEFRVDMPGLELKPSIPVRDQPTHVRTFVPSTLQGPTTSNPTTSDRASLLGATQTRNEAQE